MGNKQTNEKKQAILYENLFELYNAGYLIDFKDCILEKGDLINHINLRISYTNTEFNGKIYAGYDWTWIIYNKKSMQSEKWLQEEIHKIADSAVIRFKMSYKVSYKIVKDSDVAFVILDKQAQTKADLIAFIYRNFVLSPLPAYEDIKPSAPPVYSGEPDVTETTKD